MDFGVGISAGAVFGLILILVEIIKTLVTKHFERKEEKSQPDYEVEFAEQKIFLEQANTNLASTREDVLDLKHAVSELVTLQKESIASHDRLCNKFDQLLMEMMRRG